jgi:glucokinase-like ROK family protein
MIDSHVSTKRNGREHAPTKASQTELSVLRLIQSNPYISRVELAQSSALSTAAITGVVGSLVAKNLLVENGFRTRSAGAGRRRVPLTLNSELGNILGVDIGTYNLRVALTDLNGKVLGYCEGRTEMGQGREAVLDRCFQYVNKTLTSAKVAPTCVLGVGVAFSGVIDSERGIVLAYPRVGHSEQWKNIPLQQIFETRLGIPCLLEDSARTVAMSERFSGLGQRYNDFVYVDAGMGIGASIFIGGRIYRGFTGTAGEFGHVTVDENGPLCSCGNTGCLEAMASSTTIIEAVRRALSKGVASKMLEMAHGDTNNISIEIIAKAATENDSLAFRVLSEAASHIGASATDLVNLLNPQAIIFGGALFRAAPDLLLDQIKRVVRQRALEKAVNDVQLLVSPLGSNAGALGAARLRSAGLVDQLYRQAQSKTNSLAN